MRVRVISMNEPRDGAQPKDMLPVDKWWFKSAVVLYSAALTLLWPVFFLVYAVQSQHLGKYRKSFRFRLGLDRVTFPARGSRVWIHALSVGETLSVLPFVRALRGLAPDVEIVFSSATEAGHEIAVKQLGSWVQKFFFMPHDFPWLVKHYVSQINPGMFVLVETDIWPNLCLALKRQGVCLVLLNGRISEKSFARLRPWRDLLKPLYTSFQWIFVQSEMDKLRFETLGGPKGRVQALGNVKFDASSQAFQPSELETLRKETGIGFDRPVWIAGSTHPGEEEVLLETHARLQEDFPDLLLLLAPRQIGRTPQVLRMAGNYQFKVALRSTRDRAQGKDVFLLDTLGELRKFYALAQAAFIGGSLVPFGGHNPLEATAQCIPALWGPHLFNFREIETQLLEAGCGFLVVDPGELREALRSLLANPMKRRQISERAATFWRLQGGASAEIARRLCHEVLWDVS